MKAMINGRIPTNILALLVVFLFSTVNAQDAAPEKVYVEVGCIKAKSPEIESFIMDKGMAFNKAARDKGMIIDFIVLKVLFPNGDDCRCDYRIVSVFTDMAQLDMLVKPETGYEIATQAFGDEAQAVYDQWKAVGIDRGSELFELKMEAVEGPAYSPMSMVNFVNVDRENAMEYEKMEKEVWMPVVREAIKAGMLTDMSIWQRVLPEGDDLDGDYLQVIDIKNFAQMGDWEWEKFAKIFKKVHPEVDMMKMIQKSDKLSNLDHNETMMVMARLSAME